MREEIQKDIKFYRMLLIPSLTSKGNAGYKSTQIAQHLTRFIARIEMALGLVEPKTETPATPADAERIFNEPTI